MTQIPYRVPRELAEFIVANYANSNEMERISAEKCGEKHGGPLAVDDVMATGTLGDVCDSLESSIRLLQLIVVHGERSGISPAILRGTLREQAAIAKRLIDEIVAVYTAFERN